MNSKAIYGVFERGVCLYVGATGNPKLRFDIHKNYKFRGRRITCRVLRWVKRNVALIEGQVIRSYKRRGQAKFNKRQNLDSGKLTIAQIGKRLTGISTGKPFTLSTASERRMAYVIAKALGKRITSKQTKRGFQIFALGD